MSNDVRFAREIEATIEKAFDAFPHRGGQEAFYGTDDPGWIVESECDLRVGVWTVTFGRSRDELHRHDHVFRVIDRPSRLVVDTTETRANGSRLEFETEFSPPDISLRCETRVVGSRDQRASTHSGHERPHGGRVAWA